MSAAGAEPFSLVGTDAAMACANATGYAFRLGEPPTSAQLRLMCGQDDCAKTMNSVLLRGMNSPSRTPLERRQLSEFAYVVFDFCYYYREPGRPCASDFLPQFMVDLRDLVSTCETKSGVSFTAGPNATDIDISALCGIDECDNLMRRLYVKPWVRSCEPTFTLYTENGNLPLSYVPVMKNWVYPYMNTCPVAITTTWYLPVTYYDSESVKYVHLPGPLPEESTTTTPPTAEIPSPILSPIPSKIPEPSSSTIPLVTSSQGGTLSTTVPTQPNSTVTSIPNVTPSTVRTLTPSPSPSATSTDTSASLDASHVSSGEGSRGSFASAMADALEPAAGREAAPAPTVEATASSSSSTVVWTLGLGMATIAVMLFAFIVYHRRRRRTSKSTKKHDDSSYRSMTDFGDTTSEVGGALLACQEIPVAQLQEVRIIGGGGSGVVYLVRDTGNDNRLLASKRTNKRNVTSSEIDAFVAEIALAASLSHPRIVQFVAIAGLHKSDLQGLFEYMPGGDLCRYLSLLPPVDPARHSWTAQKLQIAIDVADALTYIHTLTPKPVIHRDLKSRNVMLSSDHRAKLGDFGVSRTESAVASMTTGVGTTRWVAPEVILGGGDYSTACDIYSFGVVMTELDTQRLPFSELVNSNGDQLADFVVMELVATQRQQPALSGTCPSAIRDLTRRCLSFKPSDRPTAAEVATLLRSIQQEIG